MKQKIMAYMTKLIKCATKRTLVGSTKESFMFDALRDSEFRVNFFDSKFRGFCRGFTTTTSKFVMSAVLWK